MDTISSKDLRIGNYIDFLQDINTFLPPGNDINGVNVVYHVKVITIVGEKINNQPEKKFRPLILTPRLLAFLGYERENGWVKIGNLKFKEFQDPSNYSYSYSIMVPSELGSRMMSASYLHELQNLYFNVASDEMVVDANILVNY